MGSAATGGLSSTPAPSRPKKPTKPTQPACLPPEPFHGGSTGGHLSAEDVALFKENGFLVKRGILDPLQVELAVQYCWSRLPVFMRRDDPSTHFDPHTKWTAGKGRNSVGNNPSFKMCDCGDAEWMLDLLPRNANVQAVAKVCHYTTQPLVELYGGCVSVLKVSWCGIREGAAREREALSAHARRVHEVPLDWGPRQT